MGISLTPLTARRKTPDDVHTKETGIPTRYQVDRFGQESDFDRQCYMWQRDLGERPWRCHGCEYLHAACSP